MGKITMMMQPHLRWYRFFAIAGGGPLDGIFLCQAWVYMIHVLEEDDDRPVDEQGWFYTPDNEWRVELHISQQELESVRKRLITRGILSERWKGTPPLQFLRINFKLAEQEWEACTGKDASYQDYLRTIHWRYVRQLALQHAQFRCQVCNGTDRLQVHHRTYDHLWHEQAHLADLTVLCDTCHSTYHKETPHDPV